APAPEVPRAWGQLPQLLRRFAPTRRNPTDEAFLEAQHSLFPRTSGAHWNRWAQRVAWLGRAAGPSEPLRRDLLARPKMSHRDERPVVLLPPSSLLERPFADTLVRT